MLIVVDLKEFCTFYFLRYCVYNNLGVKIMSLKVCFYLF